MGYPRLQATRRVWRFLSKSFAIILQGLLLSETQGIRLRSEEYEALFYRLLYKIGYTVEEYDGDYSGAKRFHKYSSKNLLKEFEGVLTLYNKHCPKMIKKAMSEKAAELDPTPFLDACAKKYGRIGLEMAMEQIDVVNQAVTLNPHSIGRNTEWSNPLRLRALFSGTDEKPEKGRYIDQRFIDYLSRNPNQLSAMHWRKFEELTAEFFDREGFVVELGPGANDDGVDVRVWKAASTPSAQPLFLVQCKRQKAKIEKVVVKGLHADVQFEKADFGLIVTTSELSPGARSTVLARGYPIREINRSSLDLWLEKLRTPGTGIVRNK